MRKVRKEGNAHDINLQNICFQITTVHGFGSVSPDFPNQ